MTQFTIGSFAVIFDKKKRVLLSHRRDLDIWNLPGGGVKSGELPDETAVRETLEETGLKIKTTKLVGVYGKPYRDEIVFVYKGKVIGGKIRKTKEADQTRYFKLKKIPRNIIPKHHQRILDALNDKPSPISRWQHGLTAREWLKELQK